MSKTIPLSAAAFYSKKRVTSRMVTRENFISVDNILQNKMGISKAVKIPSNTSDMSLYEPNHILIGNIRPYLKKIWFANRSGGCSPDVLNLEVKEGFDPKFVYYALYRDDFFNHMMKGSKGSKMPRGDKNQVLEFFLPDFNISVQKKISSVLSVIDNKIELNNKINTELEAMAKLIYDYWFVQFDFPDENGRPYKSSGGKMVWSEELKREIPEGWEVKQLSDLIKIERGISYTSKDIQEAKGQPMLNLNSFYLDGSYKVDGVKYFSGTTSGNKTAAPGDLLIAATDVTRNADIIGKSFIVPNIFHGNQIYYSMDLAKIVPIAHIGNHYLRFLFNSDFYHSYIKYFATGTLVLHLNMDGVNWFKLPLPPSEIISKFNELMHSIESKKSQIIKENQKLVELRDWLLPMLMNGQVKVSE